MKFNIHFYTFSAGKKSPVLSSLHFLGFRPVQEPFFSICLPSPRCHRLLKSTLSQATAALLTVLTKTDVF